MCWSPNRSASEFDFIWKQGPYRGNQNEVIGSGLQFSMTVILLKGGSLHIETDIQRRVRDTERMPCEGQGWEWDNAPTSQGTPISPVNHQKIGERQRTNSSL